LKRTRRWASVTGLLWALAAACRGGDDDNPLNPRPEEDPSFDGEAGGADDGNQTGSGGGGGSAPINGGGGRGGSGGSSAPPLNSDEPDAGAPLDAGPSSDGGTTDAGG